jgi:DNA topoisomerase 2-associated protein PAT1
MSLEEVEAQILSGMQAPASQPVPPLPAQQVPPSQVQPEIPIAGPPVPQYVSQQQYIDHQAQFKQPQYQRGPPVQQPFSPPQQFGPPQLAPVRPSQRSPQRSPVRQNNLPPSRPTSLPGGHPPPNFQEIMAAENARLLAEDAKRRKRNQKLNEMSKYNGLMTPADKNFIQRISISQLLADPSQPHLEDFYYQVHTAIRSRSHPNQPLNSMAQTYLRGRGKRLMENQVLKAVQHARSRPKQEALSLEGALGKIAFHGSGRPRALLDVRKPINAEEQKVIGLFG